MKQYLLSIVAAAMLCSIVTAFMKKDSFLSTALKLISGIFMLLVLISPITDINIGSPIKIIDDLSLEANQITSAAAKSSRDSLCTIIKERTQTYILDKATANGVSLSVEVALSDADIPEPVSVSLSGNISPYKKKILSQIIENDLGITAEAQTWN